MSQVTDPSLPQTPKAVVKPQVLTHVIDGHVIKESSAPFPLSPSKSKSGFLCHNSYLCDIRVCVYTFNSL